MSTVENVNYKNLNNMIKYIEENLTHEIDINKLAIIVGISVNSLQRIFTFITGITIIEYIKKRRLSRAFEEIKNTNIKIIDIAVKYQYNSTIVFDRAFKKLFGVTPVECRQKNIEYKQFPMITFKNYDQYNILNYKIKSLEETEIYYYETKTNKKIDLSYKIRELYQYLKQKGIHEQLKNEEQYAISSYKNGEFYYMVGSKTKYTSNKKVKIPAGQYVEFEVDTREQKDIIDIEKTVFTKWIKSTNINIDEDFSLEYYKGQRCWIYYKIIN